MIGLDAMGSQVFHVFLSYLLHKDAVLKLLPSEQLVEVKSISGTSPMSQVRIELAKRNTQKQYNWKMKWLAFWNESEETNPMFEKTMNGDLIRNSALHMIEAGSIMKPEDFLLMMGEADTKSAKSKKNPAFKLVERRAAVEFADA